MKNLGNENQKGVLYIGIIGKVLRTNWILDFYS
jgi:hypothetical protein